MQQPILEKLPFWKHLSDDKELAKFYIQVFQKCVDKISKKQQPALEAFPQLNQIQMDKCYVLRLQSNDLIRVARKVNFLSVKKKYFTAGSFKYLICNLTLNQKNLQCRIIKVSDEKNLDQEYENLKDYKFVHFYQMDDKKNPKQSIKNTIKYYYNCAQQQKSEEGSCQLIQKSSTNKDQVSGSTAKERKLSKEINLNLKKEKSSNLIDEDSDSEESDGEASLSNSNQNTINNKQPNDNQSNYLLQKQNGLINENQQGDQSALIKNLLFMIKQRDMQILDQQQIILQQQMQQLQMQRQRIQSLEDINNYNPLQIGISSDFTKNNSNQLNANGLNQLAKKFDENSVKKQDDDQTEIIQLDDD
ncbi:hypothetical protein ABPG74_000415 [Tetrahymena malaccensis]